MGYMALIPTLGFLVIYSGNLRKTGVEVFGERIWWNDLRPIHGILYLAFAYLAINKHKNAYKVLLADVTIGLLSFLAYHFIM